MFDLEAYLERVGLSGLGGGPCLADLHRAHVTSIPFENLDPHRGVPVSLAPEDLVGKLVDARRGGYCFEHNLLLGAALEALGHEVELVLARVRLGAPPGAVRPRSHLVLRVREAGGKVWHADVGFGAGTLLEPVPWGAEGEEWVQDGWRFRIVSEGRELVLQTVAAGDWVDAYAFVPEAVPLIDLETSNWYTSTFPRSPFVSGLIVCVHGADGTRASLSDRAGPVTLTESSAAAGDTVTPVTPGDVGALLADRFGLPGWTMGADGRVARA